MVYTQLKFIVGLLLLTFGFFVMSFCGFHELCVGDGEDWSAGIIYGSAGMGFGIAVMVT